MRIVLIVTADGGLRGRLERACAQGSVVTATTDDEALRTLRVLEIDTIFRDCTGPRHDLASFVTQARELTSSAVVVAIGPDEEDAAAADFVVPAAAGPRDLDLVVRQVEDRQRLLAEIANLRSQAPIAGSAPPSAMDPLRDASALARILTEFGRLFAAGFELPRVLEMFLDAVGELLRPARLALLMLEEDGTVLRVVAHRKLAPPVVKSVRLSVTTGLGRWLLVQGRPARIQEVGDAGVARELSLLGGVVAVPLMTHGDLVGVLVVGQPVVGGGYGRLDTEVLFELSTQLATAVRDITLHQQIRQEKEFSEEILAHMASGVVTIDRDHRIGIFNRRAEEILGMKAPDVLRHDLRALPSPLGDMLFEALTTGRTLVPTEIQLALRGLWLEVSTYPIRGESGTPLGAVLVFEDRTAQKELAGQKRQTEQYQLLARVVARIADEIKNPLVSVNTFVELIDERFDELEFRKQFSTVVRRDVRRLVQVLEKLAGLVSGGELNFSVVDVQTLVDEVVTALELSDEGGSKHLYIDVNRQANPQMVRVDPSQFRKALSYLAWHLMQHSPGEDAKITISIDRQGNGELGDRVRLTIASNTAVISPDKIDRLFDPVQVVQERLIDVGPAVSQRLIEAAGGRLAVRQGRHDVSFLLTLPTASR